MNKLAQYLNQHLIGEVVVDPSVLEQLSIDGSPLSITPEMVAYPQNTSDIRKLLRFSWQLAEKGHKLPVTARGAGTDTTGGAIGSGVVVCLPTYMDRVFEYDSKQRLARLQPGATVASLQDGLSLYGVGVPELYRADRSSTVGGTIASRRTDSDSDGWIDQLEIVLANGDLLQTRRLSKRELSKKKGEQTFEGDIYRGIDGLIEENKELIQRIDELNVAGYSGLKFVKQKDGSLDLAPLFSASQGTLGIISEMIIKADVISQTQGAVIALFDDVASARDAIDGIEKIGVTSLEYFDHATLRRIFNAGKTLNFSNDETERSRVLLVTRFEGTTRTVQKKVKKITKHFSQFGATIKSTDNMQAGDLAGVASYASLSTQIESRDHATIPIADGVYVTLDRFEQFNEGLVQLATKYKTELPLYGRPFDGIWYIRPSLSLKTVSGKQNVFKLTEEIVRLIEKCGGYLNGEHSEGRMQGYSAHKTLESDLLALYTEVKKIFDPHGVLNNGVKQSGELKTLVSSLRSTYRSNHSDGLARF
jgi:FAD/FMN-containing dehydrogenase